MFVPDIFVASSSRAIPLAKQLSFRLLPKTNVHAWWKLGETFEPGGNTLGTLIEECRSCQFAVVLLTRDDVQLTIDRKRHLKPRDNCIFEAGLFTGGLGLDPKRCLLVASVHPNDLPTDLRGLTYIGFEEPRNLNSTVQCKRAVAKAARVIINTISKKRPYDRPELPCLTTKRLMSTERLDDGGRLIKGAHVVVNSPHPLERGNEFAEQVLANLENGCKYRYFFHADTKKLHVIAELLQSLAAARLGGDDSTARKTRMTKFPRRVKDNLYHLNKGLRIYFVEKEKLFYCCIHNANDPDYAVCYLRHPDEKKAVFVEWFTNENAFLMSVELTNLCKQPVAVKIKRNNNAKRELRIFCPTNEFDLFDNSKQQFKQTLWNELQEVFPDKILPYLHEACFG